MVPSWARAKRPMWLGQGPSLYSLSGEAELLGAAGTDPGERGSSMMQGGGESWSRGKVETGHLILCNRKEEEGCRHRQAEDTGRWAVDTGMQVSGL